MPTIVVTIGNSDDKLSQREWSDFWSKTATLVHQEAKHLHGEFLAHPASPWQNASWLFEGEFTARLRNRLAEIAKAYGQDSIAVTVGDTKFVEAAQ